MKIRLRALLEEKTRWKQEHALGNVNNNNLNKLRQAGVVKSNEDLAKGLNKGTINILDKSGIDYKMEKPEFMTGLKTGGNYTKVFTDGKSTIGYNENPNTFTRMTSPVYRTMNFTKKQKGLNTLANALALRHEAYETLEGKKQLAKDGRVSGKGLFITPVIGLGKKHIANAPAGMHLSADILNKEAKDLNDLSYTDAAQHFKKMRNNSGEYDAIKNDTGIDLNNTNSKNLGSNTRKINEKEKSFFHKGYQTKSKDISKQQLAQLLTLPAGVAYGLSGDDEE